MFPMSSLTTYAPYEKDECAFTKHMDELMYDTFHCRFTKEVLKEGSGFSKPLLESQCHFQHLDLDLASASADTFIRNESTVKLDEPKNITSVTIGQSEDARSRSIEIMLLTMKMGETSRFHIMWKPSSTSTKIVAHEGEETYHSSEKEECIVLVLHDFADAVPTWQLTSDQKYDLSLQHKNAGTSLFKENRIESAFFQYSQALKYVISTASMGELDDCQKQNCKQLRCNCYFNLAACQLKSENYEGVIDNCTKGLVVDSWNVKGLYRRALAYKHLGKLDQARSDLVKIVKKEPRNKTAADLLESLMSSQIENCNNDIS